MHGSDRVPDLNFDYERAWVGRAKATASTSEMALFSECMLKCARKVLDTADIVREAMLQQLSLVVNAGWLSDKWRSNCMLPLGTQHPSVPWRGNTMKNKAHVVQSILAVTENWPRFVRFLGASLWRIRR
jgi:hypothetical protein